MSFQLVVREPFGSYKKGDRITDADAVARILDGENQHHVLKVAPQTPEADAADMKGGAA